MDWTAALVQYGIAGPVIIGLATAVVVLWRVLQRMIRRQIAQAEQLAPVLHEAARALERTNEVLDGLARREVQRRSR